MIFLQMMLRKLYLMKNKLLNKKKNSNNKKKDLFHHLNLRDKPKNKENKSQTKDKNYLQLIKHKGNQMKNYLRWKNQFLNSK